MLRRAMGKKKKEVLDAEWDKFSAGMAENGFSKEATQSVWDVLLPFAGYGFNKSHTAGYGVVSYRSAWLKANYPAEAMAALLTSVGDDKDKMAVYLSDGRKMGVNVLPPDVNTSELNFTPVGDEVRCGLGAVRNVGEGVVAGIVDARKKHGLFASFEDFLNKVSLPVCNKRAIESLAKAGAFDSLGHTRSSLTLWHEQAVDAVTTVKKQEAIGQYDLFGGITDSEPGVTGLNLDLSTPEWPIDLKLQFEREMLGLYVSAHPLDGLERILADNCDISIGELLSSGRTEGHVKIAGMISKLDRKITKQGNTWAIVTIEDFDGGIECLYFPKPYSAYAEMFAPDRVVSASGRINSRDGQLNLYADGLEILDVSAASKAGAKPVVISLPLVRVDRRIISELRQILAAHPGQAPVHLRLTPQMHSKVVMVNCEKFQVDPAPAFWGDVKSLLGPGAIA
jgi:DNA polymerase-3 subunit alpha